MKEITFEPQQHDIDALEDDFIKQMVEVRKSVNLSQFQLGHLTKTAQPVIARLEKRKSSPSIATVLKLISIAGKTVKIVDIEESR